VDGLETTDRGSVEGQLLVGVERLSRHREVLHHAREVAEADVDELDVLVRDELLGLVGVLEHPAPPTPDRCAGVVDRWCGQCGWHTLCSTLRTGDFSGVTHLFRTS